MTIFSSFLILKPGVSKKVLVPALILFLSVFTVVSYGQQYTNNTADQTLRSNARVNPSTLGMELQIPLASYPGRGLGVPISLSYSSKLWRMRYDGMVETYGNPDLCYPLSAPQYSELSASGWTTSMDTPYIEYTGKNNLYNEYGYPAGNGSGVCGDSPDQTVNYARRIEVHLPGGESHELRADDTVKSYPNGDYSNPNNVNNQANWDTTYYAVDGSNLKYVEDSTMGTYRLLMPDGSFFDFSAATVSYPNIGPYGVRKALSRSDRNGNIITYHDPNTTYPNGYVTDTLGRNLPLPAGIQAPTSPTTAGSPQLYSLPGLGGNTITYQLHWKKLKGTSAAESGLTNFSQNLCYRAYGYPRPGFAQPPPGSCVLFGDQGNSWAYSTPVQVFNPIILTEIDLPNGASYKFSYDIYGKIEKITYPTGATETFQYTAIASVSSSSNATDDINVQANFGVSQRQVVESPGATPLQWTYSTGGDANPPYGYKVRTVAPDGTKMERYMHMVSTVCTGCETGTFGYDTPLVGMPYEEREYGSGSTDILRSRKITSWTSTQLPITSIAGSSVPMTAGWHPRVTKEESIIYDPATGNALSASTTTDYDGDLNQITTPVNAKTVKQYGFTTTVGSLGALQRSAETTYLSDTNYTAINLRSLPTQVQTKNAGGSVVAQSQVFYDESGYGSGGVRGQVTRTRSWSDIAGNQYIDTHAKYDAYGNLIEATDARGSKTTTAYDSAYQFAYPTSVTSAIPDPTGVNGSNAAFTGSTVYDFNTGLVTSATDANGQTSTMEYNDPLLRPTKVTAPNGQQTVTEYGAGTSSTTRYVKVSTQIDATNWKVGYSSYDGLGRTIRSQSVDSAGDVFVDAEYDNVGRVKRTTNPYRTGDTIYWTTNTYDDLGRVLTVTTPDSSVVNSAYSLATTGGQIGTVVTVTDQAGKLRRSVTNALGQLTRVDEPNDTGALGNIDTPNQPTYYSYDTLGKMVNVQQGVQNRYFLYDSLGRMLRVRQPEQEVNAALNTTQSVNGNTQWTAGSTYDANGNVLTTTDAKGVTITSTYDALNRPLTRTYSDGTPTVTNFYDGTGLSPVPQSSKGKLTKATSSVSETRYTHFDNLGRLLQSQQITDGQTYTSSYQYNLSGALTQETYPSGRVVNNTLDTNGNLSRIYGTPYPGAAEKTYADSFTYTPDNKIKQLRLGSGLWETAQFNARLQVTEFDLGQTAGASDVWKANYDYGELNTDGTVNALKNSGNIAKQTINFTGLATPLVQSYKYDPLYRLTEAKETSGATQTWIQDWSYDRYGNRTAFTQNTGGVQSSTTPAIDTNTNRFVSNQGFTFDKNGNVAIDAEGRQFTFDGDNKQTQVKDVNNTTVGQYSYDGNGKRIKKTTPTENTVFVYDGTGKLVEEYSGSTLQTSYLYAGNQLLATETATDTNYTATDQLGSPRVVTNASGQVVSRRDFLPFGEEIFADGVIRTTANKYSLTGQDAVRQRFTGYQRDLETGLDFAEARYYNNSQGRFTAVDPLLASGKSSNPQTFNRYVYTMNRPLILTDSKGLQAGSSNRGVKETDLRNGSQSSNGGGSREIAYFLAHPSIATAIGTPSTYGTNISSIASRFAENSAFKDNRTGGNINALRHGIWSAIISKDFGAETAKNATNAHEPADTVQIPPGGVFKDRERADSAADLKNNAIGINVGTQAAQDGLGVKDTAIAILNVFKNEGLYTTRINANGTETLVKATISQNEYNKTLQEWSRRDNAGFTAEGRREMEEQRKKQFENNYKRAGGRYQE